MTALELERIARTAIPPVGATAAVAVVEHEPGELLKNGSPSGKGGRTRHGAAWVIDGRRRSAPIALFDRPRDAIRLVDLLNGEAPRPGQRDLAALRSATSRDAAGQSEAPTASHAGSGSDQGMQEPVVCAGCGGPLPPAHRGQRRMTCSDRCRRAAARRAAAEAARADTDGATAPVTPSQAPRPDLGLL